MSIKRKFRRNNLLRKKIFLMQLQEVSCRTFFKHQVKQAGATKPPPIKKAAANAAAKARRWIQELQINVGVHGVMTRNLQVI